MNQTQREHAALLRGAFEEYLQCVNKTSLEPGGQLLSYDFDFLKYRKWHGLAETMVGCDLRELTNLINGWGNSLCRWHAWSLVLKDRDEKTSWELRNEFLDSLAHECLLKPSSIRDIITSVATSAFHQVRLSIDQSYPDYLQGEPKTSNEKPKWLKQKQKEKRLSSIVSIWPDSSYFLEHLRKINTDGYISTTQDYRNLTSHSIGPRLGIGHTRTVRRTVNPAMALKPVEGGCYEKVIVPGKMSVSYGFGGTPPLDLETVRASNLEQYMKARSCYVEYRALLETTVIQIASAESAT